MGTLKVNGDISATGNISASSFLGNASSASKWATARTIKIGKTGKSVDGCSNVSWTHYELGVPYCYDTSPTDSPAYSYWGMLISRGENKYGQSGTEDNYFIGVNSNSQLHIGHQLNGTSIITWTNILSEHNYSSYALPLSGGTIAATTSTNTPLAIKSGDVDAYIRFENKNGTILGYYGINANKQPVFFYDRDKILLHSENYSSYCAPASHNHTSLSNITSLTFATHADDSATIGANVDGSSTYFDFNLLDDGATDKFRWRFSRYDSATATAPWSDLMTLTTISPTDSTAYLRVNGTISADWFSGTASNASYLISLGGTTTASVRNYDSNVSLSTGGWADANAGYGYTWGTTLDISGYSTWYHRLAFRTDGNIEYWHGINTKTMTKVGNLCFTGHSHSSYLPLSGGTMTGNIIIGSNYITGETGSSVAKCHGLQIGYPNHDYWTFSEWGGLYHFYKYQVSGSTVTVNTLCGSINEYGWVQGPGGYGSTFPSSPAVGQVFYKT